MRSLHPRLSPATERRRTALLAFAAAAAACAGLAGCGGGGGGGESELYTLSATRSCLDKAGLETSVIKDPYLPGSGGNLRVHVTKAEPLLDPSQRSGNAETGYVFVVFDRDPAAALETQDRALDLAEKSFQHEQVLMTRAALKKGVALNRNVFYYSPTGALTGAERTKVASCLR